MARPHKPKEYEHCNYIYVQLSDIELENINATAEVAGLSQSEYIRRALLDAKVDLKYEIIADMADLQKLTAEYEKIGLNLNQIARHFNTGGSRSLAMESEICECIFHLVQLRKGVLKLAGDFNGGA